MFRTETLFYSVNSVRGLYTTVCRTFSLIQRLLTEPCSYTMEDLIFSGIQFLLFDQSTTQITNEIWGQESPFEKPVNLYPKYTFTVITSLTRLLLKYFFYLYVPISEEYIRHRWSAWCWLDIKVLYLWIFSLKIFYNVRSAWFVFV